MNAKTCTIATALLVSLSLATLARADDKPLTPQQQKMATCSQEAKEKSLKGAERTTFMSDCLKAEKAAKKNSQQEKMKDCNKQAAGKKGAERKAFMKECLSASHT
jgi:psiF repeat